MNDLKKNKYSLFIFKFLAKSWTNILAEEDRKIKKRSCSRQNGWLFSCSFRAIRSKAGLGRHFNQHFRSGEHRKTESFCETFTAATLAWALGLWLSSTEAPDGHYLETSALSLLLSPPQTTALPVHRPRWVKLVFWNSSNSTENGWLTKIPLTITVQLSKACFAGLEDLFYLLCEKYLLIWASLASSFVDLLFVRRRASVRCLLQVLRQVPSCSEWQRAVRLLQFGIQHPV